MFQELNENNFENEISTGLKLVDFYADWCGYCKKQQEVLNDLSEGGFWIGKVDCESNQKLSEKFGITGLPTMVLFKNGKIAAKITGFHTKGELLNELMPHIS